MAKLTLSDVANLSNENTAVSTINSNSSAIEAALENTLSRDGTTPNQMSAALDMNSNRIINLPAPISSAEPLRLADLSDVGSVTVYSIPTGGTAGQTLVKNTSTNYDVSWGTVQSLPVGGTTGQVLSKSSGTDYAVSWTTPVTDISGLTGLGTGVASALAINVGTAGSIVTQNGTLGTPSSATLTNATGLPVSTGISGLGTGVATFLATPSSANLASAVTDETGTGSLVFSSAPTLTNPVVGTQSARDNSTKAASTAYVDGATRERLTASRTYYVRSDGSDSNTGLANTAGGAFLTLQKAMDTIASLDCSTYDVTVQAGAGTYAALILKTYLGSGTVTFLGDATTPSNCVISTSSVCIYASSVSGGNFVINGFRIQSSANHGVLNSSRTKVTLTNMEYNSSAAGGIHIYAQSYGEIVCTGNHKVLTGATNLFRSELLAKLYINSTTFTFGASVTFSVTANVVSSAYMEAVAVTFSLGAFTVTGTRYNVSGLGNCVTGGGGANYFPGNAAGTGSNPGASPYGLYS